MKYKTTFKDLKQAYKLVAVGYCELQRALNYKSANAYVSSKMYGWRADIYELENFTIVTGYSTPSHAVDLPYDLCRKIEKQCENQSPDVRYEILNREVLAFIADKF